MTFKQFEKIAKKYRPDIKVSKHGDYCTNRSNNTLGISFNDSKVYDYHGSYMDILKRLGCPVEFKAELENAKKHLQYLLDTDGKESFFGICDNSREIQRYKNWIAEAETKELI